MSKNEPKDSKSHEKLQETKKSEKKGRSSNYQDRAQFADPRSDVQGRA